MDSLAAAPLPLLTQTVQPEWVDYNDHLRDAFYLLVFSYASDALMGQLGLDAAGRERLHSSIYTLECHINYLHEVKLGSELQVDMQLLAHDSKRLHIYFSMYRPDLSEPVAVSEQMLLHVDTRGPRSAPFSAEVLARVQALYVAHRQLPRPRHVGRTMGLPPQAT